MRNNTVRVLLLFILLFVVNETLLANANFYAYYTKLPHSATDYMGKYADLIVVLDEDKQLEFSRQTAYLPRWRTPKGTFLLDDFFPGRDQDYEFFYTYVRLIEESSDKIVVHWRYFADIKTLEQANSELNSLIDHGFTGVIHEIFTISPDGTVKREIYEATGTRSNDWFTPDFTPTQQTIRLTNEGVQHGSVQWSRSGTSRRPAVEGNSVKSATGLEQAARIWSFDEGLRNHRDRVTEKVSGARCPITGLMTVFKKGVSGTALAFDGYTTGVMLAREENPELKDELTLEAWIALDVLPYNIAPILHNSKSFGKEGYYFGIDAYGHLLLTINGQTIKSSVSLPLYTWTHVAATLNKSKMSIYIDGKEESTALSNTSLASPETDIFIGLNSEMERCTDYVRTPEQNLPFIYGLQGLLDEVKIYDKVLTLEQLKKSYQAFLPADRISELEKGVLPGELGKADKFGARFTQLKFHELWDNMWRTTNYPDIVVKFDQITTSVVYWRGTNYAASWVTDNNRWMADQSSEIFTKHGCSEHMADKQTRHSYAQIIENSPARVVIHWRYPCVDVSYYCANRQNWSDEYHTIYPDGTGVRKVFWNRGYNSPGFQDIQFFTNPGESALDVVNLQAMTVANDNGEVQELTWSPPNNIPKITIENACIEVLNSKSKYKVFAIFQGGRINPWGENEQSKYTDDPFAGPWNHWPVHFVPSDGRFAVSTDRVTHFALGANDAAPEFGSMVLYGFTDQAIANLIPLAKSWRNPAALSDITGAENQAYDKDQKAYVFIANADKIAFTVNASKASPVVNPCLVIKNWGRNNDAILKIGASVIKNGPEFRQGLIRDTDGSLTKIMWLKKEVAQITNFEISK